LNITIEDLKKTAALAHLNLDEDELAAVFPAFEQMLRYFGAIQAADEDRAAFPETLDSTGTDNFPIADSVFFCSDNNDTLSNTNDLINNAGKRDGRFVAIPNVR
jgi:aspartyl-tRNA(Asn)/glutamyl-tRNA(Gln) amidotransferase subunit C